MGRLFRLMRRNNTHNTSKTTKTKETKEIKTMKTENTTKQIKTPNKDVIEKLNRQLEPYAQTALILSIMIKCDTCNNFIEITDTDIQIGYIMFGYPKNDTIETVFRPRRDIKCERCKQLILSKDKNYKIQMKYINARINRILKIEKL